jgi:hypothetical protein
MTMMPALFVGATIGVALTFILPYPISMFVPGIIGLASVSVIVK